MKIPLLTAKQTKTLQEKLNTPEYLKQLRETELNQKIEKQLQFIAEDINNRIKENLSSVLCLCSLDIINPVQQHLTQLGYIVEQRKNHPQAQVYNCDRLFIKW